VRNAWCVTNCHCIIPAYDVYRYSPGVTASHTDISLGQSNSETIAPTYTTVSESLKVLTTDTSTLHPATNNSSQSVVSSLPSPEPDDIVSTTLSPATTHEIYGDETTTSLISRMWKPTAAINIQPLLQTASSTVSSYQDVNGFLPGPSTAVYRFFFKPKTPSWLNNQPSPTTESVVNFATSTQTVDLRTTTPAHHNPSSTRLTSQLTTPEADDFRSTALKPISTTPVTPEVVQSTTSRQATTNTWPTSTISTTVEMMTSSESRDINMTTTSSATGQQTNDTLFTSGLSRLLNQLGINVTSSAADNLLHRFLYRLLTSGQY